MTYALLQKTLDIPPVEKLKAAFQRSRVLTAVDASILANDAFGILVKGQSTEAAHALQRALQEEEIETDIIAENQLPQLPQTKFIRRLECTPEALMLHDPLGRPFALEWKHIALIAAGNVRLQDFNRIRTEREVTRFDGNGNTYTTTEVDYTTKEESNFHFLVEIVLNRAVLRYSVEANKPFLFQNLGGRFTPDLVQSFALFVQQLLSFAPQVAINRGSYYLRENAEAPFAYPSKNAFYEEIIWLLWKMQ